MNDFDKQIAEIYREMELHLIQSMKRNLALHVAEEGKIGITYPQWQAIKLKELKRYQRQNKRIVDKYTRGLSKEIAQHMKDELDQGAMSQFKLHKEALGAGYKSAKLMKDSFFKVDDRAVSALIDSLQNDMATANSAVLRMVNDVYRETIFKSAMFVKNDVCTEKQAYDMAIKSFLEKGINCIQYKDGRRVNIADYAEMAVRTVSQRAHLAGQGEFRKEIGRTLILISRHNTACELCKPFEHKVLIDDVYSGGKPEDGDYMLLSEAMKLGLYHPRCRHGCGTYYPELEEINHYETEDNKLNEYSDDKIDAAHVENMIQKYKRLSLGSTLSENVVKYSEKLKYWENLRQPKTVDNIAESGIISKGSIFGGESYNPQDINRAIQQNNTNFVTTDPNNPEYLYGEAIKAVEPIQGIYDIKAHGDYDGVKIFDTPIDANELARIILMRNDYNGEPIRLLSCNTGKVVNGTCVAQELADFLGVEVIAPNDILITDGKGLLIVGKSRFRNTGEFKHFYPR